MEQLSPLQAKRAPLLVPYRVFLSHSGNDTYLCENFFRPKIEHAGATLFLDSGKILYGDDFRKIIFSELAGCHELLILLTPASLSRPWIFAEMGASLALGKRVCAMRYGTTEAELHEKGILSILGTSNIPAIDHFDLYIQQLGNRVKGSGA
jgi:hypothetical protein